VYRPFSILERIERAATRLGGDFWWARPGLSVSSNGSNALQLQSGTSCWPIPHGFQYPRTDRTRCNGSKCLCHACGSCAFQYPRTDRTRCNSGVARCGTWRSRSFSILERIERAATRCRSPTRRCATSFQYPRTDRTRCNCELRKTAPGNLGDFQYPRTDRTRCNLIAAGDGLLLYVAFSILERIERAATGGTRELQPTPRRAFSILERIERAATKQRSHSYWRSLKTFSILERIERAATASDT